MTTDGGGGRGAVVVACCGLALGVGVFLLGTGLAGAGTIAVGCAVAVLLLTVLVVRGGGGAPRARPDADDLGRDDPPGSRPGRVALRGAAAGAVVGVVANGALEVSSWMAEGGLDEEWIDTFLVWDVPSTLVCTCLGALAGQTWGRWRDRRRRIRA